MYPQNTGFYCVNNSSAMYCSSTDLKRYRFIKSEHCEQFRITIVILHKNCNRYLQMLVLTLIHSTCVFQNLIKNVAVVSVVGAPLPAVNVQMVPIGSCFLLNYQSYSDEMLTTKTKHGPVT